MNKIVLFFLFILFFLLFDCFKVFKVNSELDLLGKIIYVDAGHGGTDPGAISGKIVEADINLEIAIKLKELLISHGAIVYMTREYDNDLSYPNSYMRKKSDLINRARMIDKTNSDMYISIHLNSSSDTSWHGAQVFYDDINSNNKLLAEFIQNGFKRDLKSNREVKEISDLYMYKNTKTLGVLVEVGFISNSRERGLLQSDSYQVKIVSSIFNSISNYYKGLGV